MNSININLCRDLKLNTSAPQGEPGESGPPGIGGEPGKKVSSQRSEFNSSAVWFMTSMA